MWQDVGTDGRKAWFHKVRKWVTGGRTGGGGVIGLFESGKSIFSKTTEDEGKPFGRMKGLS